MLRRCGLEARRRALLAKAGPGAYRAYLARPFPEASRDVRELDLLALDLETGGLDPETSEILSLGHVALQGGRVRLGSARHLLVAARKPVPEASAAIHGLLDRHLHAGVTEGAALEELLAALAGKVLVAHFAELERAFLDAACRRHYGLPFLAPTVDTLRLERRRLERRGAPVGPEELRLGAVRARYGLARHRPHHALADALATAELFLALSEHMAGGGALPLRDLLV